MKLKHSKYKEIKIFKKLDILLRQNKCLNFVFKMLNTFKNIKVYILKTKILQHKG